MFDKQSSVTNILERVLLGKTLEAHEKAVLTYTTLVLRDFSIETNDELVGALR